MPDISNFSRCLRAQYWQSSDLSIVPFHCRFFRTYFLLCPFVADSSGHSCASQGLATQATTSTEASFATSVVKARVHAIDLREQVQEPPPAKEWWQREVSRRPVGPARSIRFQRNHSCSAKHVDASCTLYCSKKRYIESDPNDSQHWL